MKDNKKTKHRKRKWLRSCFYFFFFLIGILILFYPTISDRWNQYRANRLISDYVQNVVPQEKEDYAEQWEAARIYNEKLVGGEVPDVFAVRENEDDPEYEALLNIREDQMMGFVEIPVIDVYLPIFHYCNVEVLEKGAGHIAGSSLPTGGESTHSVISAHRGLPSAKMFTDLNLMKEKDLFFLHVLNEIHAYEVDTILTVEPDETRSLAIEIGEDTCTLVTCTPYAVNTHRLLVHGHRVPYEEEVYEKVLEQPKAVNKTMIWAQFVCVLIGFLLAFLIISLVNLKQKRRKKGGKKET